MYKVGYIRKIEVRNFVTYGDVQMLPGPNLNMIVGPNGTGKSTIVAAIILGLGGKVKTIGRGTKVSEYVKRDCEKATINIYLQGEEENSFIKITREFDKNDRTTWRMNGQRCTIADINHCTKQLNIQVDNLCQFLPQDRVADFAKLNKQELLKQTQIAICKDNLIEKQTELISMRESHKEKLEDIKKLAEELQEIKDANSRLEGKVASFNNVLEYKGKIAHLERKIEWIIFEETRNQIELLKKDKFSAQKVLENYRNELKPIERLISDYKEKSNCIKENDTTIIQAIRDLERDIDQTCEKIHTANSSIGEIQDEISMGLSEIENRNQQIEEALSKLSDKEKLHTILMNKLAQCEKEKVTGTNEISKCTNILNQLRINKTQLEHELIEEKTKLGSLQHDITRIENIKQERLEQLRRLSKDAYTAVMWLRNNRHQFKGDVFEPIMLELNVFERNKAKYIESIIPRRDRMAFTCTDKNDMNMFIHCLREKQRLSINVLHSDYNSTNRPQSEIPLEQLRKYGFYTYLNTLFSAPDPIMNYLCQTYKLHNIPLGDSSTNSTYERVPRNINVFFSDVFRFGINYSKYSGQKSTTQNEVKGDGGFSCVMDFNQLETLRGSSEESHNRIQELQGKIQNIDAQITRVQEKINVYRETINGILKQKREADNIKDSIVKVQENIELMRNSLKDPHEVREKGKEKLKRLVRNVKLLQEILKTQMQQLKDFFKKNSINFIKLIWIREKIDQLENNSSDAKRKVKEAENTFNTIVDKYNKLMQDGKAQLQKAKSLSNGFAPSDDGFDEFREIFDQLPDDLQELNDQRENFITKISCLNTADSEELERYQNGQKLIKDLAEKLESRGNELHAVEKKMEQLKKDWLDPLNELIFSINARFSAAFERLGCAGEVTIYKGDDDQNFAGYGISIKVSYRSGEPLQELTATIQSGGERAVATAAFMLSLQELTPVPFRCVDEINQGMDSNNERRIFELIVQTTCQADTSQYFIITPKLVPNLSYPRKMFVHFVHNGPFINSDRKWSASKFCNPLQVM
ncbi:structural maintenance of chromosomes 5 [Rhynchophorus ferrugineus]|uniref:structural maintenance of chromosomes 5 n=1 Tax=Rhynchophorus ferrugineus TaxID=354439 RepID=UPI003FCCE5D7